MDLDGTEGLNCYWRDLCTEPESFPTSQQGGRSIIICGTIACQGTLLIGIEGTIDPMYFCNVLEHTLTPNATQRFSNAWKFKQDKAGVQSLQYKK